MEPAGFAKMEDLRQTHLKRIHLRPWRCPEGNEIQTVLFGGFTDSPPKIIEIHAGESGKEYSNGFGWAFWHEFLRAPQFGLAPLKLYRIGGCVNAGKGKRVNGWADESRFARATRDTRTSGTPDEWTVGCFEMLGRQVVGGNASMVKTVVVRNVDGRTVKMVR